MAKYVLVADLTDQATGKTFRQLNNEKVHKIPIGTLVEVKSSSCHGNGACEKWHARLYVWSHDRDCDGTPLYSLSYKHPNISKTNWQSWWLPFLGLELINPQKLDDLARVIFNVRHGFSEESLKVVEITEELLQGENSLTWEEEND